MDIPTLFFVLNLSYVANIIFALVLFFGGSEFPGARLWIGAQFSAAFGTLLMVLRENVPYYLLALGNTLLFASTLLYAHAAWRFRFGTRFPHWFYLFLASFGVVFLMLENQPINLRTALVSAAMASASLWTFLIFIQSVPKPFRYASWVTGLPFLIYFAVNTFIAINSLLSEPIRFLWQSGPAYSFSLLVSILTASVSLFGYYLLAGIWKQESLEAASRRLSETNHELIKTNQTKDYFVSMLAHDLRTPITGAVGYIRKHLLPEDIDLAEKRRGLEVLVLSLEKTQRFLENVLWWSRSQKEDWVQHKESVNVADIAQSVVVRLAPSAVEKNQAFELKLQYAQAEVDADSVEMIFQNLISNAIKFSNPQGVIEVETGLQGGRKAFFRVTDQGVGISQEVREKMFQMEQKVATVGTMGELGTGLGLILCHEFSRLNDAHLILTSEPGIGTTVMVVFSPVATQGPVSIKDA